MENKYNILNSAVGIYKIPAKWEFQKDLNKFKKNKSINFIFNNGIESINEHKYRKTNIDDNIYFNMFLGYVKYNKIKKSHYIFIDEYIDQNITFNYKSTTVWVLNNIKDVLFFSNAKYYILRGNYPNFYNLLVNTKSFIIFYPATSFKFSYNLKACRPRIKNKIISKTKRDIKKIYLKGIPDFYEKINIALCHEDEYYKKLFKNSKLIEFYKYASKEFYFLNLKRDYDFIFVADATQSSKNHELYFKFMNYCELSQLNLKFIYVSNKSLLKESIINYNDDYSYIELEYYNNITPKILNRLYNKTKINLTLSGRDAVPRTISESLAAGCYNIALDTLSDGKNYFNNIYGELVGGNNELVVLRKSNYSLSYLGSEYIWKCLLNIHSKSYNHEMISISSMKEYNIKNLLKHICQDTSYEYEEL
jgi:hypothetical protein